MPAATPVSCYRSYARSYRLSCGGRSEMLRGAGIRWLGRAKIKGIAFVSSQMSEWLKCLCRLTASRCTTGWVPRTSLRGEGALSGESAKVLWIALLNRAVATTNG